MAKKCRTIGTSDHKKEVSMLSESETQLIQRWLAEGVPIKTIARDLGVSKNTVKSRRDGFVPKKRLGAVHQFLNDHAEEVAKLFRECQGHCPAMIREIRDRHGMEVSLRAMQRFCKDQRRSMTAAELKGSDGCGRFETAPGKQLQIDFATETVAIGGRPTVVKFFVCILGYSRRIFVKAFDDESQASWLNGIESGLQYFGGVPREIVSDNAKALVTDHNRRSALRFTPEYQFICTHYGLHPVATGVRKPYSKGKVERAVRYMRENFLAGFRGADTMDDLNSRLLAWMKESDGRRLKDPLMPGLGTPLERWEIEKERLRCLPQTRIAAERDVKRKVTDKGLIQVEGRHYRVGRHLSGLTVHVRVSGNTVAVDAGSETIKLDKAGDEFKPSIQAVSNRGEKPREQQEKEAAWPQYQSPSLQRPTAAYDCLFEAAGKNEEDGS